MDFQELLDANHAALYRFALSLTKSEDRAADLVQETFYRWAAKGQQLRDPSRAKSWLFTTLYREFIKARRHESVFAQVDLSDVPEGITAVDLIPEEVDSAAVREILFAFEEIYRAPLVLFFLNQLSYREIAETLGIPIGTVMSRISRGKARLRRCLSEERNCCPPRKVIPMFQSNNLPNEKRRS
jgi:RNA polymerase sigma factor (sigma-70 family)